MNAGIAGARQCVSEQPINCTISAIVFNLLLYTLKAVNGGVSANTMSQWNIAALIH